MMDLENLKTEYLSLYKDYLEWKEYPQSIIDSFTGKTSFERVLNWTKQRKASLISMVNDKAEDMNLQGIHILDLEACDNTDTIAKKIQKVNT